MIPRPDILVANLTDVGVARSGNQDYYGYFEPESDEDFNRLGRLIVVCDGVGGHSGGEVASLISTQAILQHYSQAQTDNVTEALDAAILAGNQAILDESERRPDIRDMATTCVAIVLRHGTAYVAHVGDSRAYLIRQGELHQLTIDHSLVQQMVIEGLISEDEMETHPRKNVILRSLGLQAKIEIDHQSLPYAVDDLFMLSSDGLTGPVDKVACLEVAVRLFDQPLEAAEELVERACQQGGPDNITVQIVRILAMTVEDGQRRMERKGPEWQHLGQDPRPSSPTSLPTEYEMTKHERSPSAEAAPTAEQSSLPAAAEAGAEASTQAAAVAPPAVPGGPISAGRSPGALIWAGLRGFFCGIGRGFRWIGRRFVGRMRRRG